MLHRSRSFASEGGSPVDILTFDDFRDYSVIRGVLQDRGFLSEGHAVRNLWEELPAMADPCRQGNFRAGCRKSDLWLIRSFGCSVRRGASGTGRPAQAARALRERREVDVAGRSFSVRRHALALGSARCGATGGTRRTVTDTVYSEGAPLQHWGSAWGLYRSWLDYVVAGEQAYFVVDNKNTARFMASYQRDHPSFCIRSTKAT